MKKRNGITLIALVITIIVLLILAGITINLTIGEHGILNMAKESKNKTNQGITKEKNALNNYEKYTLNYIDNTNSNLIEIQIKVYIDLDTSTSFTIKSERGMTWGEWYNSTYCIKETPLACGNVRMSWMLDDDGMLSLGDGETSYTYGGSLNSDMVIPGGGTVVMEISGE